MTDLRCAAADVHGLRLEIGADREDLLEAATQLLRPFVRPDANARADGVLVLRTASNGALTRAGRVSARGGRVVAELFGGSMLVSDPMAKRAEVGFPADTLDERVAQSVIYQGLAEILRANGFFPVHAAGLERDGRAVLIPGQSGRGKTTTCLALLAAGFGYLSDDNPLLTSDEGRPVLRAFPVDLDVTADTLALFPALRAIPSSEGLRGKRRYAPEDLGLRVAERAEAGLVLVPNVVEDDRCGVEPMSRAAVLAELIRHGLVAGRLDTRDGFALMSRLVEWSDCYRLDLGRDLASLPAIVDDLLARRCHSPTSRSERGDHGQPGAS